MPRQQDADLDSDMPIFKVSQGGLRQGRLRSLSVEARLLGLGDELAPSVDSTHESAQAGSDECYGVYRQLRRLPTSGASDNFPFADNLQPDFVCDRRSVHKMLMWPWPGHP